MRSVDGHVQNVQVRCASYAKETPKAKPMQHLKEDDGADAAPQTCGGSSGRRFARRLFTRLELGEVQAELPLHACKSGSGQSVSAHVVRRHRGEVLHRRFGTWLQACGTTGEETDVTRTRR